MTDASISAVIAAAFRDQEQTPETDEIVEAIDPAQAGSAEPQQAPGVRKKRNIGPSNSAKKLRPKAGADSKTTLVLRKLHAARGVTVAQVMEATDWQAHSVRGFLSAVVKKKLGLNLVSEIGKDGQRRYRVAAATIDAGRQG